MMRNAYLAVLVILVLAGCSATPPKHGTTFDQISAEMNKAGQDRVKPAQADVVGAALLPPLKVEMPKAGGKPLEQRFDLVVSNAPAGQVFMGIVNGTRYSMLVHPDVIGTISVHLKDVTVFEALDAIREIYGYDYKVEGTRIYIEPLSMQTRIYKVNYLIGRRSGTSDTRVYSGSVSSAPAPSTSTGTTSTTSGGTSSPQDGSSIYTTTRNDFWADLEDSVRTVVGCKMPTRSMGGGASPAGMTGGAAAQRNVETVSGRGVEGCDGGRSVVVSPQSGMVVVRAEPAQLRDVSAFLSASQISVERQVILEAKIIEVTLSDGYQAGVNWGAFRTGSNTRLSTGSANPGTVLQTNGSLATGASAIDTVAGTFTNPSLSALPGTNLVTNPTNVAGLFGLAFQTSNFAALIQFLETQGNVQVLSSPRIATLNNQKAVLKVGVDEFFVTNVTTTTTTGTATTSTPSVTLQPFFSGIALDVTPQIDENNNITLHIHPTVSKVTTVNKTVDLGTAGSMNLPLASSNVSETDSIVRAQDGQIVAIGGLMKQTMNEDRSQVPGAGDAPFLGALFRHTNQSSVKTELVILLKPTVIQDDNSWQRDILESQRRIQKMNRGFSYGGKAEVFGVGAEKQ
ncbi:pilus (MSHA type) biogenesis protein MshL [Sulfurimicrobium lacus]|uniref:Pilus (MSHA type) biogenesis protein MshL n=1 Tax=Sulfurimicrobium lacus TaxID=2715678 RepID=A0A6F8V8G1_9PROT|nr:pilus (MSHA type) biogenesis protein MshL [Sulfurimicrobium lacus]BCB25407.1 pilus (MSHA type) biogenesis protein MshL [Sulfurimicrobium lacus]